MIAMPESDGSFSVRTSSASRQWLQYANQLIDICDTLRPRHIANDSDDDDEAEPIDSPKPTEQTPLNHGIPVRLVNICNDERDDC